MADDKLLSCFVICPIGPKDSDIRARSNDVFDGLIKPTCLEHGYEAKRVIDESRPGEITRQIIESVMESDLVIADLTGQNPNVMYELALRHLSRLPFIHMAEEPADIPFDISVISAIHLERSGFQAIDGTRQELGKHIKAVKNGTANFENPVSRYQERVQLLKSGDPKQIELAELKDEMAKTNKFVNELAEEVLMGNRIPDPFNPPPPLSGALSGLVTSSGFRRMGANALSAADGKPESRRGLLAQDALNRLSNMIADFDEQDTEDK